jgi:uncharacterized protein YqjF (DUF2071 family)
VSRIFLTAAWRNLLMLNYAVDPAFLQPYVPAGTELDTHHGRTYISLIGFEFNHTRVLGVVIPFHQDFEEVNVRFYVRRRHQDGDRRGVVFISELVPRRAIAAVARFAFNEKYTRVPMAHHIAYREDGQVASAEFSWRADREPCVLQMETGGPAYLPDEGSEPQFITEHYWGYAAQRNGGCLEYEVKHPQWRVWDAKRASFTGNAASIYGPEIAGILTRTPDSAFLAQGSAVSVSKGVRIA